MNKLLLLFIVLILTFPVDALARGGGRHGGGGHYSGSRSHSSRSYSHSSGKKSYSSTIKHYRSNRAQGVARDSRGRIKRSSAAKHDFMKSTGYPNGRPGYVVDHVVPLKRGGADDPSNMQWQTKAAAKAKDKTE